MKRSNSHRSAYQCYPYLTAQEFAEACHGLDRRYCQATLGPLRRRWRLHVHTALDVSLEGGHPGYTTFLQITRPLDDGTAADSDLAAQMGDCSLGEDQESSMQLDIDRAVVEMEDSDKEVLPRSSTRPNFDVGYAKYEIHLHPTYHAPCLWFSLHNLPAAEPAFDVESVFRYLVPRHFKDALRQAGPIGGISIDHHPLTGVPSFFVHPCVLGDAMTGFDCPKEDYLMVWLGLVGGCVGLWVPRQMATVQGA
ncbi:hypothetical protein GGS23DRAFT_403486 [Durotheca rogersii]|uniref:uncharacterized protein n=1 Tax=Durotheca rogersii TaxID=419775 RepID=UPI00221E7626|nr:uncharacterized protein GGS23DRAFT_403486 [Durotheca rogersii]KAI5864996.1 hypothetical protein GGS23DRAFT_403486 [Durotheca rogersii]